MSIAGTIYGILTGDTGLRALVEERVYPDVLRQGAAVPAVVYTVISDVPQLVIGGAKPTMRRARVQVDCYALHLDEAQQVADAVAELLGSRSEVRFTSSELDRETSYEDKTLYHRVRMDFSTWRNV